VGRAVRGAARSGAPDDGTPEGGARGLTAAPESSDPEAVARQICLKMLTAAPRTRAQLATALARRGVPAEAAEAVLDRFAEVQLIDDAMFARAWVESRHHGRGLARRALAAELRQRGVETNDIKAAVSDLDPEREYATARALIERRLPGTRGLARPARFRRLMGVLARKGYPEGLAYRVVREALEYEPGDDGVAGVAGVADAAEGGDRPGAELGGEPDGW
jgi:regulatory protein